LRALPNKAYLNLLTLFVGRLISTSRSVFKHSSFSIAMEPMPRWYLRLYISDNVLYQTYKRSAMSNPCDESQPFEAATYHVKCPACGTCNRVQVTEQYDVAREFRIP
jgi:hypothetical protein